VLLPLSLSILFTSGEPDLISSSQTCFSPAWRLTNLSTRGTYNRELRAPSHSTVTVGDMRGYQGSFDFTLWTALQGLWAMQT
jgi:hypothetical protein